MIILKRTHEKQIEEKSKRITELETYLREAKDLKEILSKMSCMTINGQDFSVTGGTWCIPSDTLNLPDNVMVIVDDILGGKCVKQEANKCIIVTKDGDVRTGLTKNKVDKGYSYKLIRE